MAITQEQYAKRFASAHPGTQVEVVKFKGTHKPVLLRCPIHGEVTASNGSNALITVHACPACGRETGMHALRTSSTFKNLPHKHMPEADLQARLDASPTPDCTFSHRDTQDNRYVFLLCPRHGLQRKQTAFLTKGCPLCAAERPRHRRTKAQIAADNAKKLEESQV